MKLERYISKIYIIESRFYRVECLKPCEVAASYCAPPLLEFTVAGPKGLAIKTPFLLKISDNLKLFHLRKLLSNVLKIHKNFLSIKIAQQTGELDEKMDYYYLDNIHKKCKGKIMIEIKKLGIDQKETPRYILANSSIYNKLQEFLKAPNEGIVEEVWKMLLSVPMNERILEKLRKMAVEEGGDPVKSWEKYFNLSEDYDSSSLAYYLHILKDIVKNADKAAIFSKKGGLVFLLSVFSKKTAGPKTKLNLVCIEHSLCILASFIKKDTIKIIFPIREMVEKMWNETFSIISWMVTGNPAMDEDSETQVLEPCLKMLELIVEFKPEFVERVVQKEYVNILIECNQE